MNALSASVIALEAKKVWLETLPLEVRRANAAIEPAMATVAMT